MKHYVFGHHCLVYRNSFTRRRKRRTEGKPVVGEVSHIGIRTRKSVDVCWFWLSGEDRERVQSVFLDAHAAVSAYQFSHDGLEDFAVAFSPFGNQNF
jgi:hypothetical protein